MIGAPRAEPRVLPFIDSQRAAGVRAAFV